jgi:uncharacterized protein YdeI (YjbR/CyaY-like superfamily)
MADQDRLELANAAGWAGWLVDNHGASTGVWLVIAKKGAPRATVSYADALDEALCWGWIDGQKRPHDEHFWLQRFTPRGPRSKWSQRNRAKATELIAQRRMRAPGQAQIEQARGDGRWDAAYPSQSRATVPEDFAAALDQNPAAKACFETLTSANRYSFLYRIHDAKRPETRARRIREYVQMLAEGRTFH